MKKMKRIKQIMMILTLILSLVACGTEGSGNNSKQEGNKESVTTEKQTESSQTDKAKEYKIGILQIAEHSALDANREGFVKALDDAGIKAKIDYKNAQGDLNNCFAMAKKFVDDNVDIIFAIATPAAQAAKQATAGTNIPVIFSSVTDPVAAQLVESMEEPKENITGTSDKSPTKIQLEIFKQLDSEIKNIGIIYNTGETNSEIQLKEAEKVAAELGLTILPVGINSVNDIPKAMEVMLDKTDGMYALTDNMVASSLELISHIALDHKYIVVQSYLDESDAAEGVLISNGFSYYDLGVETGEMAVQILKGEKTADQLPVRTVSKTENMVRQKALDALGINPDLDIIKNARIK